MKSILQLFGIPVLLFVLLSSCSPDNPAQKLTLSSVGEIEQPVELPPGKILSDVSQLTTPDGVAFQKTPAIFFAKPEKDEVTFCALLPKTFTAENQPLTPAEATTPFSFSEKDGKLLLSENEALVFAYNFGMQLADNVPKRYKRSSYVHPIYDAKGQTLTDDFPEDHYHHRGLSWMWPKVFVNDRRYDIWHIYGMRNELEGIHQVFENWTIRETGPVCALLGAKNHWELDDKQKVMDEEVLLRVFRQTDYGRAIDVKLTWKAVENIRISGQDKKGYGGLCLRFAKRQDTRITSQSGYEASDSDLRRYSWADFSARFEDSPEHSGIAVFQHPYNPEFPAGWCLRYYGFLGVAWPGIEEVTLKPGEELTLSFRLWIHNGDAAEGRVEKAYSVYQGQLMLEE